MNKKKKLEMYYFRSPAIILRSGAEVTAVTFPTHKLPNNLCEGSIA